jgi:transposase
MTLAYSGKAFRKVVWKTSQQIWAELHQEAFRAFGGCVRHIVPDFVAGNKIGQHYRGYCARDTAMSSHSLACLPHRRDRIILRL